VDDEGPNDPAGGEQPAAGARLSQDRGLRAVALAAAAVLVIFGFGLLGEASAVVVFWILLGLTCLAFGHRSLLAARQPGLPASHRRFWRIMTFAGFCYAAGTPTQIPALIRDPLSFDSKFSGPVHAAALAIGTISIVVSMLTQPLGIDSRDAKRRFWLDVSTVMVASATVGSYFTELPGTGQGAGQDLLRVAAHLLIGPAAFQVGVFAVVKLHLGGHAPFTRASAAALGAAAAITGTTQAVRTELAEHGRLHWHFGATLLAVLLLIACARIQQLDARGPRRSERPRARPYSVLPYVALAAINGLLVTVLAVNGLDGRAWIVITGSVTCVALVVVRQLAAFRDNARLLAKLDTNVRELNDVLAERNRLSEELHHQAFHDALTGLANRALFTEHVDRAALSRASDGLAAAIMLVDLDDFKPVNDQYGHGAGDELLTEVAARLRACVRDGDVVARLGGDEFAVLCERLEPGAVAPLAERIVEVVSEPFSVAGAEVRVSASVGVATGEPGAFTPGALLHTADVAMYAAKRQGKGRYALAESVVDAPSFP
jgi:diguanylate cyclase (GGDEF)-like protein